MVCGPVAAVEMLLRQARPTRDGLRPLDPDQPPDGRPGEQFAANHTANGISGQAEYVASGPGHRRIRRGGAGTSLVIRGARSVAHAEPDRMTRFHTDFMKDLAHAGCRQDIRDKVELSRRNAP